MLIIINLIIVIYILFDGIIRKCPGSAFLCALVSSILGPVALAIYWSVRPLKEGEVREGGRAWNFFKYFAVFWTLFILIVLISVFVEAGGQINQMQSEIEEIGFTIGFSIGIMTIIILWGIILVGVAALGILLKKNTEVEVGPTGALKS